MLIKLNIIQQAYGLKFLFFFFLFCGPPEAGPANPSLSSLTQWGCSTSAPRAAAMARHWKTAELSL